MFSKKDAEFVDLALETLTAIASLVGGATAENAGSVLTVLKVIVKSLEDAHSGVITSDVVRADLKKLTAAIDANDDAADAALRKKFDKP